MGHWFAGNGGSPVWVEDYKPPQEQQPSRYPTRGVACGDGLMAHVMLDRTKREITEFSLAPGRSKRDTWMKPYCLEPQLAIGAAFDKNPDEAIHARRLAEYYASQAVKR